MKVEIIKLDELEPYLEFVRLESMLVEKLKIVEKNQIGCGVVSTRSIPLNSSKIRGFRE